MANPTVSTPIPDQSHNVAQDVAIDLSQNFSDADAGDSLLWSVESGLPAGTGLSVNAQTGEISGTPTQADVSASPITVLVKATDKGGLSATISMLLEATQTASIDPPNAIVRSDGSADPNNLGVPVFTDIAGGVSSIGDGQIVEIQAINGSATFANGMNLLASGTNGSERTVRGRSGDLIVIYLNNGFCLSADDISYWKIQNIQFGRDESLNGWTYADSGANVEHNRTINLTGTTSFLRFSDCTFYGGKWFDSGNIAVTVEKVGFIDCEFLFTKAQDDGNAVTGKADRLVFVRCKGSFCGHDVLSLNGNYCAIVDCVFDGSWNVFETGAGTRAFNIEGSKGTSPYGPIFFQGNVLKNQFTDPTTGERSQAKYISYRGLFRRNYHFDGEDSVFINSPLQNSASPSSYRRICHETVYGYGSITNETDININAALGSANITDGFRYNEYKNNLFVELGNTNLGNTDQHIRMRRTNVGRVSEGEANFPNGFRGDIWDGNLFHRADAGDVYFDIRDGTANISNTIDNVETSHAAHVLNSITGQTPVFTNVVDRASSTLSTIESGMQLTAGSPGKSVAVKLTQANGSGAVSAALIVDDSLWFAALSDSNTYDLSYFADDLPKEYVKIGTNDSVEVTAVDYDTHTLTLAATKTWADNDNIFLVDPDGSTLCDDVGASQ